MKCGHTEPSNENTAYKVSISEKFTEEYTVVLDGENSVNLKINDNNYSGKWTMVYDEGFNIDTEEWTFFAFSKYSPAIMKNGKYNFTIWGLFY